MVYAYDKNIQMPVSDLYDTQLMAMAINAAKDLYDRAEKQMDELTDLYSKFYSPSDADMRTWNDTVVKPIQSKIDELQARGIDPLRSKEGQTTLAQMRRRLPWDKINELKLTAETGKEFMKNAAKLLAEGLYDPEFLKFIDADLKNWDTYSKGAFLYTSPVAIGSIADDTDYLYKGRELMPLTAELVTKAGIKYDPDYDYTGFLKEHMLDAAKLALPELLKKPEWQYRAKLISEQLARINPNVTPEEILNALAETIANANPKYLAGPIGKINTSKTLRGSYGRSGGGSGSGGYSSSTGEDNNIYGYSTQEYLFNQGLARIFGKDVLTIKDIRNGNSDAFDDLINNLKAIIGRHMNNNNVSWQGVLNDMQFSDDVTRIAEILRLKQTTEDLSKSVYSLPNEELNNIFSGQHLFSRIAGYSINNRSTVTKSLREKYKKYKRGEVKVAPTGQVLTYLSVDGTIKQYAKVHLMASHYNDNNELENKDEDFAYIDLGTSSYKVENKKENGTRSPINIDHTRSTLRRSGYEDRDKKITSDKTESVKTDYSN